MRKQLIKTITLLFSFLFLFTTNGFAATINAASCSWTDVQAAINSASTGDMVVVPAGSCTWTTTNPVIVNKEIILQGNGIDSTVISCSGSNYTPIVNVTAANVTIKGFTFTASSANSSYPIKIVSTGSNFRVTANKFQEAITGGVRVVRAYGVIDNNTFAHSAGSSEFIQVQGPCDGWITDHTIGTANNVFIENNLLTASGYVTCNAEARCVFRYNTITGGNKIDLHGKCSSINDGCPGQPSHSGRHIEVYNNLWTPAGGYFDIMALRGGTGRVFGNRVNVTANQIVWFKIQEYAAYYSTCYGYTPNCACTYPALDQIGRGKDQGLEPLYLWDNYYSLAGGAQNEWTYASGPANNCATVELCGEAFDKEIMIQVNRDYYTSATKPDAMSGYTSYTCPHPLVGLGSCSATIKGQTGYTAGKTPRAPQSLRIGGGS